MSAEIDEIFQRVAALNSQVSQPAQLTGKDNYVAACKAGRDLADRARSYQQECAAIGLHVTAAAAVSHVLKEGVQK